MHFELLLIYLHIYFQLYNHVYMCILMWMVVYFINNFFADVHTIDKWSMKRTFLIEFILKGSWIFFTTTIATSVRITLNLLKMFRVLSISGDLNRVSSGIIFWINSNIFSNSRSRKWRIVRAKLIVTSRIIMTCFNIFQ